MEYLGTVGWGSSIKKCHYINKNTLIHPILCGEPIHNLKFYGANMGCIFLNSGKNECICFEQLGFFWTASYSTLGTTRCMRNQNGVE